MKNKYGPITTGMYVHINGFKRAVGLYYWHNVNVKPAHPVEGSLTVTTTHSSYQHLIIMIIYQDQ